MGIQIGDRLPSCSYRSRSRAVSRASRPRTCFAGKKVVLFAVPGAFTPTCSLKHLPGFIEKAAEIRAMKSATRRGTSYVSVFTHSPLRLSPRP